VLWIRRVEAYRFDANELGKTRIEGPSGRSGRLEFSCRLTSE
jgi:hypothetical protein